MNRLPVTVLSGLLGAGKRYSRQLDDPFRAGGWRGIHSRCSLRHNEFDLFVQYNFDTDLSWFGNNLNLGSS
jgi:hypothetical protein